MTALAANMDREAAASTRAQEASARAQDAITVLIGKLDDQMGMEREARILQSAVEEKARIAVATDLKLFSTKILVGLGILVVIGQFLLPLLGPGIRQSLNLP